MKDHTLDQTLDQSHKLPRESSRQPSSAADAQLNLSNKRRLLVSTFIGSSAVLSGSLNHWSQPVVQSVLLPAHAQATGVVQRDPLPATLTFEDGASTVNANPSQTRIEFTIGESFNTLPDGFPQVALLLSRPEDDDVRISKRVDIPFGATGEAVATALRKAINVEDTVDTINANAGDIYGATNVYGTLPTDGNNGRASNPDFVASSDDNILTVYQLITSVTDEEVDTDLDGLTLKLVSGSSDGDVPEVLISAKISAFRGAIQHVPEAQAKVTFPVAPFVSKGGDNDDRVIIDGVEVELGIYDLTGTEVAARIASAINAFVDEDGEAKDYTASAEGNEVTLTKIATGLDGNVEIEVSNTYYATS